MNYFKNYLLIITTMIANFIYVYSVLKIQPMSINEYVEYLPTSSLLPINTITDYTDACTLRKMKGIINSVYTLVSHGLLNKCEIEDRKITYKTNFQEIMITIAKLFKFLDAEIHSKIINELFAVYKIIQEVQTPKNTIKNEGFPVEKCMKFQKLILNAGNPDLYSKKVQMMAIPIRMSIKMNPICDHLFNSVFIDESEVKLFMNIFKKTIKINDQEFTKAWRNFRMTSNIVGYIDVKSEENESDVKSEENESDVKSEVNESDVKSKKNELSTRNISPEKLLIEHYKNLLCIFKDFITSLKGVEKYPSDSQIDYLILIFEEFINIYNYAELLRKNINFTDVSRELALNYYFDIAFRDYFTQFITEYTVIDENGNITPDSYKTVKNAILNKKYLEYLFIDTYAYESEIESFKDTNPFDTQFHDCKPFDWITIDPETLDTKILNRDLSEDEKTKQFSFISKINRLKHRQLVSEYTVNIIIQSMNNK